MKSKSAIWLAIILTIAGCGESNPDAERQGLDAATQWLSVVDTKSYDNSWSQAGALFRDQIEQSEWVDMVSQVRNPLGDLISRTSSSTNYATSMSGAPDGEYVICIFTTEYENKEEAKETVTTVKESNGEWRVVGYYIN